MPTPIVKGITAWSFSRFLDYRQCPLKAKLKHVDRIKEPDRPAFAKGNEVHKAAEQYVTAPKAPKMHPALVTFKNEFNELRKLRNSVSTEGQWAFTREWKPTGWFDRDVWLRATLDAYVQHPDQGRIIDYKTGKKYDYHNDQLELYAPVVAAQYGSAAPKTISAEMWYLDHGVDHKVTFKLSDVPKLMTKWEKNTKKMLNDRAFKPTPNDKCKWCFYRKDNAGKGGGQCPL